MILGSLRVMVRDLDPRVLSPEQAVELVDWFAEVERLGHAGKTIAAGRAAEGDVWRAAGDRSAADWLAKRTGTNVGEAKEALETAAKLHDAPATAAALRAGALSAKQAGAIAPAAAADPLAEARLLDLAKQQGLQKLRDECARVQAAADPDPKARHDRIRMNRFWKRWTRSDGSRAGMYAGTPEEVALIEAAAQPFIDARIDAARRDREHEPSDAYAFDGLAAMATSTMQARPSPNAPLDDSDITIDRDSETETDAFDGTTCADDTPSSDDTTDYSTTADATPRSDVRAARGGRGRKRLSERRELILIANLQAWQRGYLVPGETCEIPGVGPVPIELAREMFGDALLRVVIRDGVDIRTVVHTGRTANALQETAVYVRQMGRCRKPSCGLPIAEIDHTIDYAKCEITTLDKLVGLCGHDHDLKSRDGHTYRLNPDGTITWIRPDGSEEHERPPP